MQLEIRRQGLHLTPEFRDYVSRRLSFALDRFQTAVLWVNVHLADLNGPRGGIDKRCRMVLRTCKGQTLTIEEHDAGLRELVDRTAGRLRQLVGRVLGRKRQRSHRERDWQTERGAD